MIDSNFISKNKVRQLFCYMFISDWTGFNAFERKISSIVTFLGLTVQTRYRRLRKMRNTAGLD